MPGLSESEDTDFYNIEKSIYLKAYLLVEDKIFNKAGQVLLKNIIDHP